MARKIIDPEFSLSEYASLYIKKKKELDALDKEVKTINARMKELMKEQDITEAHCDEGVVTYSVQERKSFDEDKLIVQLKHFAPDTECIKQKEYVDMEVLENEIYKGLLSNDAMCSLDACRIVKEVEVLKISKGGK